MEEDEKSAVIGGDWYYVASTNRLESIGPGDNARIIEDKTTLMNNGYSSLKLATKFHESEHGRVGTTKCGS